MKKISDSPVNKAKEESFTPEDPSPMARDTKSRSACISRPGSNHALRSKRLLEVTHSNHSSSIENNNLTQPIRLEGLKLAPSPRGPITNTRDFNLFFGFKQPASKPRLLMERTKEQVFKTGKEEKTEEEQPKQVGNIAQPVSKIAAGIYH